MGGLTVPIFAEGLTFLLALGCFGSGGFDGDEADAEAVAFREVLVAFWTGVPESSSIPNNAPRSVSPSDLSRLLDSSRSRFPSATASDTSSW